MGERIGNLTRRESMSIFMAILLGLAAILIAAAGPMLASITSASPTPSAQRGANATQATKGGNAAGTGCLTAGPSSFTDAEADYYWSSTTLEGQDRAYFGDIDHGHVLNGAFTTPLRVWPVRGGQR